MRPLILVPTINSRHWNACYLQLLSVQRCQHPPQAERCCWGGGSRPPQQQSARTYSPASSPPPPLHPRLVFERTLEAVVFTAPSSPVGSRRARR